MKTFAIFLLAAAIFALAFGVFKFQQTAAAAQADVHRITADVDTIGQDVHKMLGPAAQAGQVGTNAIDRAKFCADPKNAIKCANPASVLDVFK
jgi:hypothetical protein